MKPKFDPSMVRQFTGATQYSKVLPTFVSLVESSTSWAAGHQPDGAERKVFLVDLGIGDLDRAVQAVGGQCRHLSLLFSRFDDASGRQSGTYPPSPLRWAIPRNLNAPGSIALRHRCRPKRWHPDLSADQSVLQHQAAGQMRSSSSQQAIPCLPRYWSPQWTGDLGCTEDQSIQQPLFHLT